VIGAAMIAAIAQSGAQPLHARSAEEARALSTGTQPGPAMRVAEDLVAEHSS
jgi:hypothetical protein